MTQQADFPRWGEIPLPSGRRAAWALLKRSFGGLSARARVRLYRAFKSDAAALVVPMLGMELKDEFVLAIISYATKRAEEVCDDGTLDLALIECWSFAYDVADEASRLALKFQKIRRERWAQENEERVRVLKQAA